MKTLITVLCFVIYSTFLFGQNQSQHLNLNGMWDFCQTDKATDAPAFNSKILVPGLIHLANPKIKEYTKFFKKPQGSQFQPNHNVYQIDYTPMYSWYRKQVLVGKNMAGMEAILKIKKSQYVTQVFVNGIDLGSYMQCYTPIYVPITRALKFGQENEIVIKVADRYWLPSAAAGSTDKEKEHYLPGIWDDVSLDFTDKIAVISVLILPSLQKERLQVKLRLWDLNPSQWTGAVPMTDTCTVKIQVKEKKTGRVVTSFSKDKVVIRKDCVNDVVLDDFAFNKPHAWTPDDPFLYVAEITIVHQNKVSDVIEKQFAMRDFERRGKFFYLNGQKMLLRGTNITLQRFFEDPECGNLAWDKGWVKKMLIDIPKKLNWNAMRICVSIAPDFWYDLADEYGLMFQNEWLYWQNHGWNEEIRKEYTDWVWADGSHPSIVIWDGINENYNDFIGNTLIPELKVLDPTRVWDAGYMTNSVMNNDDMDEPHPYMGHQFMRNPKNKEVYPLGQLDFEPAIIKKAEESPSAQLINEYGWVWLWRDGTPSKLTVPVYNKYLGKNSTADQRQTYQAYWLQLETEWLRSSKHLAGVLAFCYLTNNYGFTGDWFTGHIKDLTPTPTLNWFKECFAPVNVFINLADERYAVKTNSHKGSSQLNFQCIGVNDEWQKVNGTLKIQLFDSNGKVVTSNQQKVDLPANERTIMNANIKLPAKAGGYMIETQFKRSKNIAPVTSRRYIRVGDCGDNPVFYEPAIPSIY